MANKPCAPSLPDSSYLFVLLGFFVYLACPVHAQDDAGSLSAVAAVEQATVAAIEKAEHSVVAIARVRRDQAPSAQADPLRLGNLFPFQDTPDNPDFVPTFFGSGVIITADGFLVTCAHVLDDPRQNDYFVWLDKQSYPARVVGRPAQVYAADPFSDLAVLKIDADNLTPAKLGSSTDLRKGQFVVALGNPYAIARDGEASASWGIISNLRRVAPAEGETNNLITKESLHQFGTLIQTDAKLNLGTSGGALINLRGEMIGLTTSLAAISGYEQAAGFAVAVDAMFLRVIESMKLGQLPEYGFLGVQPEDLRPADRRRGLSGAKVSVVKNGLPGDLAGLRPEDIIIQVGDKPIRDRNDLFRELSLTGAGTLVDLHVQRFRPNRRSPDILVLPATLSKKYVATTRPGYAIKGLPRWRGMVVEYATAVPSESGTVSDHRGSPKLAILAVDPDTPAWNAGLRPGYGILSVDGGMPESPEEFRATVEGLSDEVSIVVARRSGRPETVAIEPEPSGD